MLGYAWKRNLDMKAFQLQFITHPVREMSITEEVEKVLSGGCLSGFSCVIRMLMNRHCWKRVGRFADCATDMEPYSSLMTMWSLVKELNADGVHLGKNDMPLAEARRPARYA